MSMEHLCLIFYCICVSAVLVAHEEVVKLSHFPAQLHVRLGEMAIFTCNLTALNFTPEDINWYKTTNMQQIKIADTKNSISNRLNITTDWGKKKAVLYITNVTMNDSGQYYCKHLNLEKNVFIFTSNKSELIVESLNYSATTGNNQTKQKESWDQSPKSGKNTVIATSILVVLLLMLLIGIATFLMWHKQKNKMPQPQIRQLEKPTQDPNIYTVDYEVLDFEKNQPYRKSAEISIQEQVEYATIMFP